MQMARSHTSPGDRTLNRMIAGVILVLIIGIPLVGVLYFFDQYRDPGPSLADRATQSAEEAVRTSPNSTSARFTLAELYAAKGRNADAMTQYDEILKAEPGATTVLIARGRAEVALNQVDAAAADFQKVIDANKDKELAKVDAELEKAYYNLGALELKRGQPGKAADLLAQAVRINTTDADALYLLGTALVQSGDPKSGTDSLRLALALVPTGWCEPYGALGTAYTAQADSAGSQYANGMLALCERRYDEARTQLTAASSGTYAVDSFVGLGLLAEEQGDAAAASAAYEQALAKEPQNFLATIGLGRVRSASGASAAPSAGASEGN